jgi:hypothetical protein
MKLRALFRRRASRESSEPSESAEEEQTAAAAVKEAADRVRAARAGAIEAADAEKDAREAARVRAKDWAEEMARSGDYASLATMAAAPTQETYHEAFFANKALREGGSLAVEAMINHLESKFSSYLVQNLVNAGDRRAVPVLKKLLSEQSSVVDAYGYRPMVEQFIASFDSEMRQQIEAAAHAEEQQIEAARREVANYGDAQLLAVLRDLCSVYVSASSADDPEVKRLEPIATAIGERLNDSGGIKEMRRMFNAVGDVRGSRTLDMHWSGIGEWRG